MWEKFAAESGEDFSLIIPIVIYHGARSWKIGKQFASLVKEGKNAKWKKFVPHFEYELCDLSAIPAENLRGEATLRLGMSLLKYIFSPALPEKLAEVFALLNEMPRQTAIEFLAKTLRYLGASKTKISRQEVSKIMQTQLNTEPQIDWWQEFLDEWTAEAIESGRSEVEQKASANLVLRQLQKRFGDFNAATQNDIRELNLAQLEKLGEDLLDFQSREDLTAWMKQTFN